MLMRGYGYAVLATMAIGLVAPCKGQAVPEEKANTARIDRLLGQMTLEEKMGLIRGGLEPADVYQGQAGYLPGVPRLGVPSLRMADGPPGVLTRVAGQAETATMGVAATFSVKDAEANGATIGRDARSLGIDVILQPFINIDRDLTFDRAYNTFGEDPFLSGQMGAAEIGGAQALHVMAMAKHYIGYDSNAYSTVIDPQTMHEVYLQPFAAAVEAGVSSVMCSYNRVNGPFACDNAETLQGLLKKELGFEGFVTSDWGAVHSVLFINHGLDMEMPGAVYQGSPFTGLMSNFFVTKPETVEAQPLDLKALGGMLGGTIPEEPMATPMNMNAFPRDNDHSTMEAALKSGAVTEATITAAARRVLYEMDRFGYLDGKQKHTVTPQEIAMNAAVIEKTAEDAAVLLKNDEVLPLNASDLGSLAMIGPTAGQIASIGTFGERSPGLTERMVGPVEALRKLAPGAKVTFAVDDDMTGTAVPAAALSHDGKPGLMRSGGGVDATLDFTNSNGKALAPDSVTSWSGELSVPSEGDYWLYLQALGTRANISVDGKEIGRTGATFGVVHGDVQHATQDNGLPTTDGLDNVRRPVHLTAGTHKLLVEISPDTSKAPVQVRLNWMTPEARKEAHDAAIRAAKTAKTAVVFLWTRGKPVFGLPGEQDKLVEEIAAVNPNTIVVLNTSQPVAMPWIGKVKGVLEMWWTGDEGGWATAKLLLGKANPAGRLPMTWGKRLEDYPATDPAHPERSDKGVDGKTTYSEGVLVGYRWFDAQKIAPLFPFGYGLSYTRFAYSNMKVMSAPNGGVTVTVQIKNIGKVAGEEVPQVYLDAPLTASGIPGAQFAPRTLAAFDRITLAAGEEKTVTMKVAQRAFQYWATEQGQWGNPAGSRKLWVGGSSRDLRLSAEVR
jgi:beta-glucosidase